MRNVRYVGKKEVEKEQHFLMNCEAYTHIWERPKKYDQQLGYIFKVQSRSYINYGCNIDAGHK